MTIKTERIFPLLRDISEGRRRGDTGREKKKGKMEVKNERGKLRQRPWVRISPGGGRGCCEVLYDIRKRAVSSL